METKLEKLDDGKIKITVTVDAEDIDKRIKKTYKDFSHKYRFPGFRPGRAPRPVIDNALGENAVAATVTDDVVNEAYGAALDANDIVPLFAPDYEYDTDLVEAKKPYTFHATVTVKPEVELSSYEPVEIVIPGPDATDEEIDRQIEQLAGYYAGFKDAPANTKVKVDSFVEFTMTVKDEAGNEVPSLAAEKRLYELGAGLFPASFDEQLVGMKKGENKAFDVDLSEDSSMFAKSMGDKAGKYSFDVTIDVVKKKDIPAVDEKLATETFGFESLADMKEKIAESIKEQKETMQPRRKENDCLYALSQRVDIELPEGMCEIEEANLLQTFYQQLNQNNMRLDDYLKQMDITADDFKEDVKKQAADLVRQDLALDAWARNAKMSVTDEEITAEFERADVEDAKATEAEWRAKGQIPMVRQGLLRTHALIDVADTAKVEVVATEDEAREAMEKMYPSKAAKKTKKAPAKKAAEKKPAAKKKTAAKKDAE